VRGDKEGYGRGGAPQSYTGGPSEANPDVSPMCFFMTRRPTTLVHTTGEGVAEISRGDTHGLKGLGLCASSRRHQGAPVRLGIAEKKTGRSGLPPRTMRIRLRLGTLHWESGQRTRTCWLQGLRRDDCTGSSRDSDFAGCVRGIRCTGIRSDMVPGRKELTRHTYHEQMSSQ